MKTIDIDNFIEQFKAEAIKNNIEFDQESDAELREVIKTFESTCSGRAKIKTLIRFIIRQMIARPIAKKIIEDYKAGNLQLT